MLYEVITHTDMSTTIPRCILAGLSGGTGKTIVSLALARAFVRSGRIVAPFKSYNFV